MACLWGIINDARILQCFRRKRKGFLLISSIDLQVGGDYILETKPPNISLDDKANLVHSIALQEARNVVIHAII